MTNQELGEHVEKVATELAEHFDAVQILATYTDDNGTLCIKRGCGNWYARQGMAQEFISAQNAEISADFLASKLEGNSD